LLRSFDALIVTTSAVSCGPVRL